MRGHTGATMSMGNGLIYSGLWKQKMVTRSSTESEVVGVHDVLPQILWTKKFLEDQGLTIKETVLYQDNMSSMLLVLSSVGQDDLEPYEYACEVPHKLFKFKSLSSAQNYLFLTMPHDRSLMFVFLVFHWLV